MIHIGVTKMSIINGLRRLKSWEWILLFIFLVTIFLFRFKYVVADAQGLIRINRITGTAKVYEWDRRLGKFKLYWSNY